MAENLSSKVSFAEKSFSTTPAPDWRTLSHGLNIEGRCQNHSCKAYNEDVWVAKGFFQGTGGRCTLNSEVNNLKCPICSQKIDSNTVCELGIYQCKIRIYSENYESQTYISMSSGSFQYAKYQHSDTANYIATISSLQTDTITTNATTTNMRCCVVL